MKKIMFKEFLRTTIVKRGMWTVLNTLMSLCVAWVVYAASNNVAWAIGILPIVQPFSQFLTKWININYLFKKN